MDPSRKRAIRLTVALTAAVLLASALVYVSFTAGNKEFTASQLLAQGKPGQTYELAGTVLNGSVQRDGTTLLFRIRDPKLPVSVPVSYDGNRPGPVRGRPGGDGRGGEGRRGDHLRRPGELAHDQVPVEVPGGGRVVVMSRTAGCRPRNSRWR